MPVLPVQSRVFCFAPHSCFLLKALFHSLVMKYESQWSVQLPSLPLVLSHQLHVMTHDLDWPEFPSTLATKICSSVDIGPKKSQPGYSLKLSRQTLGRRNTHVIEVAELRRFWEGLGIPVAISSSMWEEAAV